VWTPGEGRREWYPSRTARSGRGQELADVVEEEDEPVDEDALPEEALLEDEGEDDDEELDELGAGSTLLLADRESVR
jgi:hypothetical protein